MCFMCDSEEGMASCPNCGRLICFDIEADDDVVSSAAINESGDLMCLQCVIRYERETEEDEEWLYEEISNADLFNLAEGP